MLAFGFGSSHPDLKVRSRWHHQKALKRRVTVLNGRFLAAKRNPIGAGVSPDRDWRERRGGDELSVVTTGI
jgi:hypothetical protein